MEPADPDDYDMTDWDESNNSDIEWEWSFRGIMSSRVAKLWLAVVVFVFVLAGVLVLAAVAAEGTHAQTLPAVTTTEAPDGRTTLPPISRVDSVTHGTIAPRTVGDEVGDTISARERTFTIPPLWLPLLGSIASLSLTSLTTRFDARPIVKGIMALVWAGVTAAIQDVIAHAGSFQLNALGDIFFVTVLMTAVGYVQLWKPAKVPEQNLLLPRSGLK